MKKNIFFFLLPFLITACSNCSKNPNRIYFTISTENHMQRIIVPVHLNDRITANMVFDSGAVDGVFRLDSSFVAYPSIVPDVCPDTALLGSTWSTHRVKTLIYNAPTMVKIGNTKLSYNQLYIYNWKKGVHINDSRDGIFNIPKHDTTHIWELNFEHNYLEIHPEENFKIPENCYICPVESNEYYAYIRLPLQIKCADGDTLTINQLFLVDTGIPDDITLMHPARELDFFNQKEDADWLIDGYNYYRHHTVNATLFDDFLMDSLCVDTYNNSYEVAGQYLVGLNFLKRFNVFFDRKHRVIGLQPIKNYEKITSKSVQFHYSAPKNSEGKFTITKVANYKGNYYKTAGLQEGDEIVAVNDTLYENISFEQYVDFYKKDTLVFDILRDGNSLKIVVVVDKDEERGD